MNQERKKGGKKGIIIAVIVVLAAAAGLLAWRHFGKGGGAADGPTAYVSTVADLTGMGSSAGTVNRYAGVVEAMDTWSVNLNPDGTVKEVLVTQGQEVKQGDPLFEYDVEKYQNDLAQAEIDLERMQNELETMAKTLAQLEKDQKKASSADKANYTIRIQEQQLQQKQRELDLQAKQTDIDKLKDNIANATVYSEIDGVVKSISSQDNNSYYYGSQDNAFITVMKTGQFQVKGSVNEQNVHSIFEGTPVLVHSRVDNKETWRGTITKIDTDNQNSNQNNYYGGGDSMTGSASYPFYITLDNSDGLMLGQHVYIEMDFGQEDEAKSGLWMYEYMFDMTDPEHPFVWADKDGKLEKREVSLGEYDEYMMQYEVLSGLSLEDAIAFPDESFTPGMRTAPMSEMPADDEWDKDTEHDESEFYVEEKV